MWTACVVSDIQQPLTVAGTRDKVQSRTMNIFMYVAMGRASYLDLRFN